MTSLVLNRRRGADRGGTAEAVGSVRLERLPLCDSKHKPRPISAAPHETQRVLLKVRNKVQTQHISEKQADGHKMTLTLLRPASFPSVCSYRPQTPFLRPRRPTELCDPTERAPCWPGLDEQSPSTATGERTFFFSPCRYI